MSDELKDIPDISIQDIENRLQAFLAEVADIEGVTVRVDVVIRLGEWELKRRIDAGSKS